MMTIMAETPSESTDLLEQAIQGDGAALGRLLERYRDRLRRMIALRLDPRVQARVDASDIIQETFIEASQRLDEFAKLTAMPFFLWLRLLVGDRLIDHHRKHLGAQARDAGREVSIYRGPMPATTTAALAAKLMGKFTSPSQAAVRAERKLRLQEALNSMDAIDREVLVLRHYEQLSNGEAALVLGLDKSAASKRYARALLRLKEILIAAGVGGDEG